jgi:hypothetical protein
MTLSQIAETLPRQHQINYKKYYPTNSNFKSAPDGSTSNTK